MDATKTAGSDFAESIAKKAIAKPERPEEDSADLGRELLGVLEKKDPAALGKLFAAQVKIAVAAALRARER